MCRKRWRLHSLCMIWMEQSLLEVLLMLLITSSSLQISLLVPRFQRQWPTLATYLNFSWHLGWPVVQTIMVLTAPTVSTLMTQLDTSPVTLSRAVECALKVIRIHKLTALSAFQDRTVVSYQLYCYTLHIGTQHCVICRSREIFMPMIYTTVIFYWNVEECVAVLKIRCSITAKIKVHSVVQ